MRIADQDLVSGLDERGHDGEERRLRAGEIGDVPRADGARRAPGVFLRQRLQEMGSPRPLE